MRTEAPHVSATVWMVNETPVRMVFAGRRWTVTDTPTRLAWTGPREHGEAEGWRFQGTDDDGRAVVFDVFHTTSGWHVHRSYE